MARESFHSVASLRVATFIWDCAMGARILLQRRSGGLLMFKLLSLLLRITPVCPGHGKISVHALD
jgi:hypothetical protein